MAGIKMDVDSEVKRNVIDQNELITCVRFAP